MRLFFSIKHSVSIQYLISIFMCCCWEQHVGKNIVIMGVIIGQIFIIISNIFISYECGRISDFAVRLVLVKWGFDTPMRWKRL